MHIAYPCISIKNINYNLAIYSFDRFIASHSRYIAIAVAYFKSRLVSLQHHHMLP